MPDPDKDLSNLTDLEREVVEQFVANYSEIVKTAPPSRGSPPLTEDAIRREALGIVLKQLDKRVADYRRRVIGERTAKSADAPGTERSRS
jgi:hypothetical protein